MFALDTVLGEFQLSKESMDSMYSDRGKQRPVVIRSNEEWYRRQGYEVFKEIPAGYEWKNPVTGKVIPVPIIYMKKTLV